ncbi:MAG TPA: D-alanyl-D-alanine carboxypeptidase/D-alanyl-D-alanine-endopeptidase [Bacteroidetes bacterium]|nr:D-alanyl-D-alanine carboxypeptidase/D-alanyl-D-alanine-endopeptidase [Bacteroidota bacterium]
MSKDKNSYVRPFTTIILFLILAFNPVNAISQNSSDATLCIAPHINDFVNDQVFRHAGISICFRDAESGYIIAGYNEALSLGSASVMKLVTTAVALETLGPDFRFTTRVGYAGNFNPADSSLKGYIVIKGGGDPSIISEYFPDHNKDIIDEWADALYHAGIRKVSGCVVSDAMIFDYHPAPGGWNWSDLGNYYGAGAHGICIYDNMYRIHFKTGNEGSIPEITKIEPEIPGLIIENRLISSGNRDNGYIYLEPYGDYAVIRGEIPPGREDFILKASIPDPPFLTARLLQQALTDRGVTFENPATSLRLSPGIAGEYRLSRKVVVHTSYSPALYEIITATNTESLNMFAEQLLKYIGLLYSNMELATSESGIIAVRESLDYFLDDTGGLYMTDGSGLSRSNAISSSFITSLLHYMNSKSRYADYFLRSLPQAATKGTLEHYFKDPVFHNNLKAKSGTSTRIRNYAGYFRTSSGKEMTFAVLVNNFDCSSSEVTMRVEGLLKKMINGL